MNNKQFQSTFFIQLSFHCFIHSKNKALYYNDGNPTGYFAREYNYGNLIKKYNLKVEESTNQILFDSHNQYSII